MHTCQEGSEDEQATVTKGGECFYELCACSRSENEEEEEEEEQRSMVDDPFISETNRNQPAGPCLGFGRVRFLWPAIRGFDLTL
jgi:hypothetical protein